MSGNTSTNRRVRSRHSNSLVAQPYLNRMYEYNADLYEFISGGSVCCVRARRVSDTASS